MAVVPLSLITMGLFQVVLGAVFEIRTLPPRRDLDGPQLQSNGKDTGLPLQSRGGEAYIITVTWGIYREPIDGPQFQTTHIGN